MDESQLQQWRTHFKSELTTLNGQSYFQCAGAHIVKEEKADKVIMTTVKKKYPQEFGDWHPYIVGHAYCKECVK